MASSIKRFPSSRIGKRKSALIQPGWTDRNLKRFNSKPVKQANDDKLPGVLLKKVS